ncbi:hypothetical protein DICPUDRAFT_87798 [Dictyostelium purpureum]|uniref:Uncharacterized protein n=1 Tax=Dictyostelium purpureum TaxID=5786 RepID=F0ZKE5_DICPU|nr:uncharacterized protein DICPUDRAFT_87798 [Dictyostelium purpureum]EGC35594.1 hypothetical protein DICPUDRAFT_87798 [Dictyostelium purpureum]|eukprot:XP_003287897.1 hypothetical protein DICPUDRAFT_87798 [Dictyostelium purpureum]
MEIKKVIGDYDKFLNIVFNHLIGCGGFKEQELIDWEIDHVCYRVSTKENYEEKKKQLGELGVNLIEANVNGRPISTYKLNKPIEFSYSGNPLIKKLIPLVELPMPKNSNTKDGLEHFEMVIGEGKDLKEFVDQHPINKQVSNWVYNGINKDFNADIEVEFYLTNQDKLDINHPQNEMDEKRTFSVKFHHQSLETVIAYEIKHGLTK